MQQVVNRFLTILFSLAGLMVLSINANAQDYISATGNPNPEVSTSEGVDNDEKIDSNTLLVKPSDEIHGKKEVKNTSKSENKSEQTKETEEKPKYGTGTKESESVLSFNFLYYIIQKFKFTDVGEQ